MRDVIVNRCAVYYVLLVAISPAFGTRGRAVIKRDHLLLSPCRQGTKKEQGGNYSSVHKWSIFSLNVKFHFIMKKGIIIFNLH